MTEAVVDAVGVPLSAIKLNDRNPRLFAPPSATGSPKSAALNPSFYRYKNNTTSPVDLYTCTCTIKTVLLYLYPSIKVGFRKLVHFSIILFQLKLREIVDFGIGLKYSLLHTRHNRALFLYTVALALFIP